MSERAFHMTPAQAEILRELAAGDSIVELPSKDYARLHTSGIRFHGNTFRSLLKLGLIEQVRKAWDSPLVISARGREALRRYEERAARKSMTDHQWIVMRQISRTALIQDLLPKDILRSLVNAGWVSVHGAEIKRAFITDAGRTALQRYEEGRA